MSLAVDCPSCAAGNHKGHNPRHGVIEGCIGGTHCDCAGDCNERFNAASSEFATWWDTLKEVDL